MSTKQIKFIIAILIQLIILFSLIIFKKTVVPSGTEVLLRINPVNPRSLRGDHLTFRYEISILDSYFFNYSPIKRGDTVYVPLKKEGNYWVATLGVQKSKPIDEKKIFIKGEVENYYNDRVWIVYGIEDYFIPEGAAQNFDFLSHTFSARVSIDEYGNAILKQVYVDGRPWP